MMKKILILLLVIAPIAAFTQPVKIGWFVNISAASEIANYAGSVGNILVVSDTSVTYNHYVYVPSGAASGDYRKADAHGRMWQATLVKGGGGGGGGGTELDGNGIVFMTGTTPSYLASTGTGNVVRASSPTISTAAFQGTTTWNFGDFLIDNNGDGSAVRFFSSIPQVHQSNYNSAGFHHDFRIQNGTTVSHNAIFGSVGSMAHNQALMLWSSSAGYHGAAWGDGRWSFGGLGTNAALFRFIGSMSIHKDSVSILSNTNSSYVVMLDTTDQVIKRIPVSTLLGSSNYVKSDGATTLSANSTLNHSTFNFTFNKNSSGNTKFTGYSSGTPVSILGLDGSDNLITSEVAPVIEPDEVVTSSTSATNLYTYDPPNGERGVFTVTLVGLQADGDNGTCAVKVIHYKSTSGGTVTIEQDTNLSALESDDGSTWAVDVSSGVIRVRVTPGTSNTTYWGVRVDPFKKFSAL